MLNVPGITVALAYYKMVSDALLARKDCKKQNKNK